MNKKIILVVAAALIVFGVSNFLMPGDKVEAEATENTEAVENTETIVNHPVATIMLGEDKKIEIELYPEIAPNTVNNFISLINKEYYNGLTFHRVIKDFMIQGGCPYGTGTGDPGYSIKGEFSENKFQNDLKHSRGVISMARSNDPDSAGSQFFIVHKDSEFLDGKYATFGKVISGIEYVDEIAESEVGIGDKPTSDVIMESVTVELNGYEFQEPEIIQ